MFKSIMKPILVFSKIIGLINISYTMSFDGLLTLNTNCYYSFLELTRMMVLVICTYNVHKNGFFLYKIILFIQVLDRYHFSENIRKMDD